MFFVLNKLQYTIIFLCFVDPILNCRFEWLINMTDYMINYWYYSLFDILLSKNCMARTIFCSLKNVQLRRQIPLRLKTSMFQPLVSYRFCILSRSQNVRCNKYAQYTFMWECSLPITNLHWVRKFCRTFSWFMKLE